MREDFCHPASPRPGQVYYLQTAQANGKPRFQPVTFLGYRPHPGEVWVRVGTEIRAVHRRSLVQKIAPNGR